MLFVKAYRFKIKINRRFQTGCEQTLEVCRELYNAALQERRDAWAMNAVSINFHAQAIQLPKLKLIREDIDAVHSQVLQDTLRKLSKAFDAFFRRVRSGQKPGYPRFKGSDRFNSFCCPQSGFRLEGNKLHLSKIGSCRVRLSRPIEGTLKTCTIKREADGWYVTFAVEENQSRFLPRTGQDIGIDVGLESFATLSTGEQIANPRFNRKAEATIAQAQRILSTKKRRSNKRKAAKKVIGKAYLKVQRQRTDFFHKLSNDLLRRFDNIAVEDLDIAQMIATVFLSKSISDAAWGTFVSVLSSKAENAGRKVWKVPGAYTSQDCSQCGHRQKKRLSERQHVC